MAITESDYLLVYKGGFPYLLLRSPTHFHLVRVDAGLSESRRERLLRRYPCSTEQLKDMGYHVSACKAENFRGVVIYGCQTGDTIELWFGFDVRKYRLGDDYSDEMLNSFFSGYLITRRLPPKWEGLDPDFIRQTTWTLNIGSILCATAFYFISVPYKLLSFLCLLFLFSAAALAVVYPSSFTLEEDSKKTKTYINKGKGHLLPACLAPSFALCLRSLEDFTFPDGRFEALLLFLLAVSLVLSTVYALLSKGLRKGLVNAIAIIIAVVLFGSGIIGQMNYLLDFNYAEQQIVQVVDKETSRSTKSVSYYCTVVLPNGEPMELSLSGRLYKKINIGDDVMVIHHEGAFHIPFSTVTLLPDAQ